MTAFIKKSTNRVFTDICYVITQDRKNLLCLCWPKTLFQASNQTPIDKTHTEKCRLIPGFYDSFLQHCLPGKHKHFGTIMWAWWHTNIRIKLKALPLWVLSHRAYSVLSIHQINGLDTVKDVPQSQLISSTIFSNTGSMIPCETLKGLIHFFTTDSPPHLWLVTFSTTSKKNKNKKKN